MSRFNRLFCALVAIVAMSGEARSNTVLPSYFNVPVNFVGNAADNLVIDFSDYNIPVDSQVLIVLNATMSAPCFTGGEEICFIDRRILYEVSVGPAKPGCTVVDENFCAPNRGFSGYQDNHAGGYPIYGGPVFGLATLSADNPFVFVSYFLSGGSSDGAENWFSGSLSVSYSSGITPVPIPAALPLLAAAIGGLGIIALRRSRKVPLAA